MRLPPLLLNLLMLLAIVLNTIPAHAHGQMPAMADAHAAMTDAEEAGADAAAMPCHDDTSAEQTEMLPASAGGDIDPPPGCCDGADGTCDCACLLQVAALASPVPRLAPAPPRAAPAGVQPAEAATPALRSPIRPPIG